jgi:hypothetical protein
MIVTGSPVIVLDTGFQRATTPHPAVASRARLDAVRSDPDLAGRDLFWLV